MLAQVIMQLERAESADVEDAYIAGMLHDIGKLMLAENSPGQFQQAMAMAAEREIPLHEAEFQVFGASHAGVGAYLLGLWGLPATMVEAVAFHHSPANSDLRCFGPLTAVHAANVLEQEFSANAANNRRSRLDEAYFAALGLSGRLEVWRKEAAKLLKPRE
jgi:putative nucleotidyltransferase with HDIG domain